MLSSQDKMDQEIQDTAMLSPICWRLEGSDKMVDSPQQQPDYLLLQQQLTWNLPLPFQPFSGDSPYPTHQKSHTPTTPEDHILYPQDNVNCRTRFTTMLSVYSSTTDLDEMMQDCWYTKQELAGFKLERKATVKQLKRVDWDASKIDQSKHELRGLEAYSSIEFNTLMQNKRKGVIHGVLREQYQQRSFGMFDPDRIRTVCTEASSWAQSRAQALGNKDATFVGSPPSPQCMEESSDSLPALSRLSYSSESSASVTSVDFSWAEKLMGEELIPDT